VVTDSDYRAVPDAVTSPATQRVGQRSSKALPPGVRLESRTSARGKHYNLFFVGSKRFESIKRAELFLQQQTSP